MSFALEPIKDIAYIKKYGNFELTFYISDGRKMGIEIRDSKACERGEPPRTSYARMNIDFLDLQTMSKEELAEFSKKAVKYCLSEICRGSHKNKKDRVLDSRRTFKDLVVIANNGFEEYLQRHEKKYEHHQVDDEERKKALTLESI
jgi:hypothetical protein